MPNDVIDNMNMLKENQEDTDSNDAKRVNRGKRSERVIQKDFRGLRRMCAGTDLEQGCLGSKDVMYHGSRVPPSATEKSNGTIVVEIKLLRQVSDTTRKQLNLLNKNKLNKGHHGSVYFTYSLYHGDMSSRAS